MVTSTKSKIFYERFFLLTDQIECKICFVGYTGRARIGWKSLLVVRRNTFHLIYTTRQIMYLIDIFLVPESTWGVSYQNSLGLSETANENGRQLPPSH